jgi:hypothetical protein
MMLLVWDLFFLAALHFLHKGGASRRRIMKMKKAFPGIKISPFVGNLGKWMKGTFVSMKSWNIKLRLQASAASLLLLLAAKSLPAAELKQETLRAWDKYMQALEVERQNRITGNSPFLSVDESPDLRLRLERNEVVVTNHDPRKVPQGMIHHWLGAVFIPNRTLDQAMGVLTNYEGYSEVYKQLLKSCSVLERDGDDIQLRAMAVQKVMSVTAAVSTDNQIHILRLDSKRAYITSHAIRIQEIADYGQADEHAFPEDRRPGYVWRAVVHERLEERDGGVCVELETVALSRGIPFEFRWLIKPLTDELPRKMIVEMLEDTRAALANGENEASK